MGVLIILTLLIEAAVLFYLDRKAWNTLYTPLNFLMLPYLAVLSVTICISGHFDFVELEYQSVVFWIVGLPLFAIPGYLLGFLVNRKQIIIEPVISDSFLPKLLLYIALFLGLIFIYRFRSMAGSSRSLVGSEDFSMEFCGHGLWAHLRQITLPIVVMMIYLVDRKHLWMIPLIILLLWINLMYQVKGWVLIPVFAGIAMRLYTGKTRLSIKLLLYTCLGAFVLFLIMYLVMPVLAGGHAGPEIFGFIFKHFFHYLTSGVLGLSIDMQKGFPDAGEFAIIWSPFINLINVLSGNDEILSPVNLFYFSTGINFTNVRTFFGTLFIYSNGLEFVLYTLFIGTCMYLLKLAAGKFNNLFVQTIYFFECSLLMMGWFEFYFFHLTVIEFPLITLILMLVVLTIKKEDRTWD